jgi:hypothetical protein
MNRLQPQNPSATAGWKTALFVAGAVLYLIAFYTAQPERWQSLVVILLPDQIVSSWVGHDWGQFQFLDRLPIAVVAGLILTLAYLGGRLSMAAVGCDRDLARLEIFVFSTALGLAQWSLLTLAVGLAGGLRGPWLHLAAVGVLAGWGTWQWKRTRGNGKEGCGDQSPAGATIGSGAGQPTTGDSPSWLERHGLWLGLPFLLLILLGAMLPPWDFDVREYHLQVPKEWYQAGRIDFLPHNVYGNMPLGAEMHALLGMVWMPGERNWWWGALAGKTVIAGFAPLTALGLLAAGRRFVTPGAGVVAALVYLSVPWVVHVSQAGLIEGVVACYLLLAVYAIAIWSCEDDRRRAATDRPGTANSMPVWPVVNDAVAPRPAWRSRILLAGFLAGAAAACKYPALLLVVAPLTLWTIFGRGRYRWRPAVLFLLAALCSCGLWYAKNWVLTGNPVYPLVFGGVSRTPERIEQWNRAHRVPPDEFGRRYSVPQAIAAAADFGWRNLWQSPLLVPLAVAAFLGARRRRLVWWLAAYAGFYLAVWWLATHRVDRFWVPILPVVALLAGIGAAWPDSRVGRCTVSLLLLAGLAANLLFLSSAGVYDHRYFVSLEQLRRDEPAQPDGLSRVQPAHRYLNGLATAGDRVLLVGDAEPFDLEMPVLYDTCFDECRFERWMKGRSAAERRAILEQEQITHVLVNWRELDRYRSPGNYGFTDYVTKSLVREELVRDQQILRPVAWNMDPEQAELFVVVQDPKQ